MSDPFVATTTPAIDRANRLISLRANPGFFDLVRLSQEIVQDAIDATSDYPGWDPQQMTVLKVRQQVAKEFHVRLFARLTNAIAEGIQEGMEQSQNLPAKTPQEILEQGDHVRQRVLEKFAEIDAVDTRTPGSY